MTAGPFCSVCRRPVERMSAPITGERRRMTLPPYRCKHCDVVVCDPYRWECWKDHWEKKHVARKIRDVETEKV